MGRCEYFTTDEDRGIIIVTSKAKDPATNLVEYRCKGVSGFAINIPQIIIRFSPDGSRSNDLGKYGTERWQRVGDVASYCRKCGTDNLMHPLPV